MENEKEDISEEEEISEEEISEEEISEELYYSDDDQYWVKVEDENLIMGLTPMGVEVYGIKKITIKPIGTYLAKGNAFAGYMGFRAGGLHMPISGTIIELNIGLRSHPELINNDPEDSGWLIKIKPSNFEEEIEQFQKVTPEEPIPEEVTPEESEESSENEVKEE